MPLYITEYAYLATDADGKPSTTPKEGGINHTAYAITTAARNAVTFNARSRFVAVTGNTAVVLAIGSAPDVSASNGHLLPASTPRLFGIDSNSPLLNFKMFI